MDIDKKKISAAKHAKVICLIIGFAYSGFAAMALLVVLLQKLMMSTFGGPPAELGMDNFLDSFHTMYMIYMPIAILLGLAYVYMGFKFKELKENLNTVNVTLRVISVILPLVYSIHSFFFMSSVFDMFSEIEGAPIDFGFIRIFQVVFGVVGMVMTMAVFIVPQYFIDKKVKVYIE